MTDEQIQSYFKDVIQKLWPKWPVNQIQFKAWAKVLRPFDNKVRALEF